MSFSEAASQYVMAERRQPSAESLFPGANKLGLRRSHHLHPGNSLKTFLNS